MSDAPEPTTHDAGREDFVRDRIRADLAAGTYDRVQTRFPPEPNGYLHIGHAKSICLNFGLAAEFDGTCNLRFDDTNPAAEELEYIDAIHDDLAWLGFEPASVFHASDYFPQLYDWAESLIAQGLAYVDDQDAETISAQRGRFGEPGENSPFRDRSPEENLGLFRQMRDGAFDDGAKVLRAKIDMAHPVMAMRDPVLYRIRRVPHQRTGDDWIIYPTYDWAHGQSDAIEGVTHSLCTLEFADHRPLYDWCLEHLDLLHGHRIGLEVTRLVPHALARTARRRREQHPEPRRLRAHEVGAVELRGHVVAGVGGLDRRLAALHDGGDHDRDGGPSPEDRDPKSRGLEVHRPDDA